MDELLIKLIKKIESLEKRIKRLEKHLDTQQELFPTERNNFKPPEQQEVIDYFNEKGYSKEAAIKAYNYYAEAKWKDATGKSVRNWKQKMIAVWFKEENKIKQGTNVSRSEIPKDYGLPAKNAITYEEYKRNKNK